eukprot:ANDGO_05042.mRNA.1 Transmembrane protein 144 homolog B
MSAAAGYIGTVIAVGFFGSNYIVTRSLNLGNGITFQWLMSIGILSVGYLSLPISEPFRFISSGILGGSLWALGNFLVTPIVKTVGLGLGFLIWSGTNMVVGYAMGKLQLFGISDDVQNQALNVVGFLFTFAALICYTFINPDAGKHDDDPRYSSINDGHHEATPISQAGSMAPMSETQKPTNTLEKASFKKRAAGCAMAAFAGTCYAASFVPFTLWHADNKDSAPAAFAFSHYSGIFLFSSFVYLAYCIYTNWYKKEEIFVNGKMAFPSWVSGFMWGLANTGFFYSQANLGYSVGYPVVSIGPTLVSSAWAIYFGEMKGRKNRLLLAASFCCVIAGVIMLLFSKLG